MKPRTPNATAVNYGHSRIARYGKCADENRDDDSTIALLMGGTTLRRDAVAVLATERTGRDIELGGQTNCSTLSWARGVNGFSVLFKTWPAPS